MPWTALRIGEVSIKSSPARQPAAHGLPVHMHITRLLEHASSKSLAGCYSVLHGAKLGQLMHVLLCSQDLAEHDAAVHCDTQEIVHCLQHHASTAFCLELEHYVSLNACHCQHVLRLFCFSTLLQDQQAP